jgi:hypothetical protein
MHDCVCHQFIDLSALPAQRQLARPSAGAHLQNLQACQYLEIENEFRASGGVISSEEVVALLMERTDQPISKLARWIVDRHVIGLRMAGTHCAAALPVRPIDHDASSCGQNGSRRTNSGND